MNCLLDFAALALFYFLAFFKKWKREGRDRLLINTAMYLYLSFVLFFTLMPVIPALPYLLDHPYTPMNMVPFIDVSLGRGDFLRQVALNVVMTVPFGLLFPLTQSGNAHFFKTVFACGLLSLGIELTQPLIHSGRSSDITDLITNSAGGAIGYGLYVVFRPGIYWVIDRLKKTEQGPPGADLGKDG